jgi:hypothetical protein
MTGTWLFRVFVRRRGEVTWTNLSDAAGDDWVVDIPPTRGGTPDSPVTQFTVNFLRSSDGRSLAPGMSGDLFNQVAGVFKPFLHPHSEIYIEAANIVKGAVAGTAVWRRWLEGVIQTVDWPGEYVTCECNSLDWVIENTDIREEEVRGAADPGTPLDDEIQGLIDRWMQTPVTLYAVDGSGDIGIGPYKPAVGKLGAQIRALAAQRLAWDVRYLWDTSTNAFRYTLYAPPRDKTDPDLFLDAGEVQEVPGLKETGEHIRNLFTATAKEPTGRVFTRHRTTVYPADSPSYLEQWMGLVLSDGDPMTIAQVDALLLAAEQDLSTPYAEMRLRLPFFPWVGLHDLVELAADSLRFDYPTQWAVVSASHSATSTDKYTEVDVRGGGPVGQFYRWKDRAAGTIPDDLDARSLYDVVGGETEPDGSRTWTWRRGDGVASVRGASRVYELPEKRSDWDDLLSRVALLRTDSINIPAASQGYYSITHVEPRDAYLRPGRVWRKVVIGTPPEVRVKVLEVPENEAGTEATIHLEMIDPRGVLTGVNVYLINVGVETGPFPATLTVPLTWEYGPFTLHPNHPVGVRLAGPRNDGHPDWAYGPFFSDTNKVPDKPDVRLVAQSGAYLIAYVDSPDTDTVAQFYRLVTGGVEGPDVAIVPRSSDPRYGSFEIEASEAGELRYHVYAENGAGVPSADYFDLRVAQYIPLGEYGGPALDVQAVAGPANYTIYWGGDNVTLSINGAAYGTPPASPITVARPATGSSPLDYSFRAERNGVPLTNLVSVVPLDADTVTPDLSVTQTAANTNNTTQGFTASATNPRTLGALPVTVRLTGCSGTNNGVALPADTDQTVNGAIVVNRPAFGAGNGAAKFSATISAGGREEIAYTIPAVQQGGAAVRLLTSETATTGTLTLTPITGVEITKIETATKAGTGAQSAWTEIFTPFTTNVTLVEKHTSLILYRVYKGTTIIQEGTQRFDLGDVANVTIASVIPNGGGVGSASVTVNGDTDTFVGVGGMKYSVASGALQNATVGANRAAIFNVTQTGAVQSLEVWGYNDALVQGPLARGEIPAGEPTVLSADVAYDGDEATVTVRFNEYTWSGTGAGRYRIDGGSAVTFDIDSTRVGVFVFTRSETAMMFVEIAGSRQSGTWGPWSPLDIERYDRPASAMTSVKGSVDDDGTDDVYTVTVNGASMDGLSLDVEFFRAGVSVGTDTFVLTDDEENILNWTDTGAGDGIANLHYVVAQLYDAATDTNYGAPMPSRVLPSII